MGCSRFPVAVALASAVLLHARPARADGIGVARVWARDFATGAQPALVGDFNGDGRDDAVMFVRDSLTDDRRGDVRVALSSGSAFQVPAVWHGWFCIGNEIPVVGDFNGDGRDDIALFKRNAPGDQAGDVLVALSTGAGFGDAQLWHSYFGIEDELPAVGDFNGDGRADIAVFKRTSPGTQAGDALVALSTGSGFGGVGLWHGDLAFGTELPRIGDFDGDGRDDVAVFELGTSGQVTVARSTGSGFGAPTVWHHYLGIAGEVPAIGDFDRDGDDDVAVFKLSTASGTPKSDVLLSWSTRSGFTGAVVWHDDFGRGNDLPAVGDFNGDRLADGLLFMRDSSSGFTVGQVQTALNADPSVELASTLARRFGFNVLRAGGRAASGERPLVVITFDFSDVPMPARHTADFFRDLYFRGGATEPKTVRGFFAENSFGLFKWRDGGVVGPYRIANNPATPVDDSMRACAMGNRALCPGTTNSEAALWAGLVERAAGTIDFRTFDVDRNGIVADGELGIVFVNSAPAGDGWAITGAMNEATARYADGTSVRVRGSIVSITNRGDFPTIVHELAHLLGAADLYGDEKGYGGGATTMTATVSGTENRTSVELDPWHKMAFGWVRPRMFDITQPGACRYLRVSPATDAPRAALTDERPIVLYDPRRPVNEFFMVEYRRNGIINKYDENAAATGVGVWYVQTDGAGVARTVAAKRMDPRGDAVVSSRPAAGSDDFLTFAAGKVSGLYHGFDEVWQSTPAGDDSYGVDVAVFHLPYDAPRGTTRYYDPSSGIFRMRYLRRVEDAELALQVAPTGDPNVVAVKWGHHALDLRPTKVSAADLACYARFK